MDVLYAVQPLIKSGKIKVLARYFPPGRAPRVPRIRDRRRGRCRE